jgi:MoaA/NifB/PqqE/SkfB family radical SAM enzyme
MSQKIVDWNFNRICNFDCAYCVNDPADKNFIGPEFRQIKPAIDRLTKDYFFALTGGELLLNPDFIKIAKYVTQRFDIGLYTNMSISMSDFVAEINPERVKWVIGSLHIKERDRRGIPRDQIIHEYEKLKKAGFDNVYIIQVCDSYALSNYDEIFEYYKDRGVLIIPTRLKSTPWYGQLYTTDDEKKMQYYVNQCTCTLFPFEMAEYRDKKGEYCVAGSQYFVITANGRIRKCWGDKDKWYGHFYDAPYWDEEAFGDEPEKCQSIVCPCYPSPLHLRVLEEAQCK